MATVSNITPRQNFIAGSAVAALVLIGGVASVVLINQYSQVKTTYVDTPLDLSGLQMDHHMSGMDHTAMMRDQH